MELLSGGDIVIRALRDSGIKYVWGYPGGAALHIYDALYRQNDVEHLLVRHEQAAVHAADGFSRATGEVGTALVTSGPGATNAITGIATAYMDSIPLVVISGQVPLTKIGQDAFQETDMVGVSRPIVKHSFLVTRAEDIAQTIAKAYYIAATGRPGPVVVDIPKDVTDPTYKVPYEYPTDIKIRSYQPTDKGHRGQIRRAVKTLIDAKRPVMYTGGGIVIDNASEHLIALARKLNYPVTNTLMGLGGYPGTDRQYLGMLGMHGTYEANTAMHHADVIFAVGARFDDRVTNDLAKFCPHATIIHIDVDPTSVSKNIEAHIPIVGTCRAVLSEILELVEESDTVPDADAIAAWWTQLDQWRADKGLYTASRYEESSGTCIKPQDVIKMLYKVTNGEAIVTSDVGQHQMFAAQYYLFDKPRMWINSGGLGTMGFGLPAAMGAKLAFPDVDVACVTGEGSIQMCIQELSTCTQHKLPVKIINLNNAALGMVRQWQDMNYNSRYSQSLYEESLPDFVALAEAYGHVGMKVTHFDELEEKMRECFAMKDRVVFMDICIDRSEHVYPMQMPGGSMRDLWLSKTERT
ncbi:MAG: acetolactate synthase 3 large subunit [Porticoccaceae bacterium]|nr:MAG: acetolactate synthase 3 catalytic subunit [SAR92 bacterium BACL16 MAG-120619-bin48]KRP25506.1 MAG: acetolactate synthase 3 catalytic subunit [SAR92 bacterium BACL16 MAG-120322-bin99]MDP4655026.1 acetolactate synthase 3 large subunit [Alphaproteobacteria bacterium]MDP4745203.1 acetolactate synthase 3 large subunit [Porticoccaceae bacterium]MDP4753354.1 acetolactate synthase 3 large subunit [Porticoccaceae bacterium]